MAIALRATGLSPGTSSTTCVIVKPVGLAVGDLMIAHVNSRVATNAHTAPKYQDGQRQSESRPEPVGADCPAGHFEHKPNKDCHDDDWRIQIPQFDVR